MSHISHFDVILHALAPPTTITIHVDWYSEIFELQLSQVGEIRP